MKLVSFKVRDRLQRSARSLVRVTLLALLCATTSVATQVQAGAVDSTFTFGPSWVGINDVTVQSDGKILVGGTFTSFQDSGIPNLVRLKTNGFVDTTFTTPLMTQYGGAANGIVFTVVAQQDGSILVGGSFDSVGFQARTNLVRLNHDGSFDPSFDQSTSYNGVIWTLAPQDDGATYVGGAFSTLGTATRPGFARLKSNGSLDDAFVPDPSPYEVHHVHTVAVQADGKVLIGGSFAVLENTVRTYLGILRLGVSGTLDNSFIPPRVPGPHSRIRKIAIQNDGRIVVVGTFASIGGVERQSIARLDANGIVDPIWPGPGAFSPRTTICSVKAMQVVDSGKLLIAGDFQQYNGGTTPGIARLNTDGTLDSTFNHPADTVISANALALQSDGGIIVGGSIIVGTLGTSLIRLAPEVSAPILTFTLQPGGVLRFDVPVGFKLQKVLNFGDTWEDVIGTSPIDVPMTDPSGFFQLKQ